MTCTGSGTASGGTMSTGSSRGRASTSTRAASRTEPSRVFTTRRPNAGCTSDRYRVWAGGSVCIIVGGVAYSAPISKVRMPLPEQ